MTKLIFREELCKGCELCRQACPKGVIERGKHINEMGYHTVKAFNEEKCIGCAFCAIMCPDLVITVLKEEK